MRRPQMRAEMRCQVRPEELSGMASRRRLSASAERRSEAAGPRLLQIYEDLALKGEHLFEAVLGGEAPRQWKHYPENDAIDEQSGFQWFYHSHSPEDRPGTAEHGHVHLFARKKLWTRRFHSARENQFSELDPRPSAPVSTRHLLAIGFDSKGVPTSLFTVNSWVTGDRMLSAVTTLDILKKISLNTGCSPVDGVIECLVHLCLDQIRDLLQERDRRLFAAGDGVLHDVQLEVLSQCRINLA